MSKEMRKYIDTFKQRLTESENLNISDVSDSDFLLRTIADRIRNNVGIIEYTDGREPELNIEDCIRIIKDDLSRYLIRKK
jgi:hypothetical protein